MHTPVPVHTHHKRLMGMDIKQARSACQPLQKENAWFRITRMGYFESASDLPLVAEGSNEGGEAANEVCAPQYFCLCGVLEAVQLSI